MQQTRRLGGSDLQVAPLAFGGNVFGWTADESTSFSMLDAFVDAGFNLIDTADRYSRWVPGHEGGESETVLGKWLARRPDRDRILIATKVGGDMGEAGKGLSRQHIVRAVENSLRRLRTDYIDLYQSHMDDLDTPVEEPLEAYDQLIRKGKVRVIGASNFAASRLASALSTGSVEGLPRYRSLQPLYNLYDRAAYEDELEPLCREQRLGVLTYFSLASGFLTGKYRSRADLPSNYRGELAGKYLDPRGFRILDALGEVAASTGSTPAQVAIAWVLARPTVTAAIASATSLEQLQELIAAARLQLDVRAMDRLNQASALEAGSGTKAS